MLITLQATFPTLDIPHILQLVGIAGFVAYMSGFAALQLGVLDGNGPYYALTNVVGAALVLVSLASAFNLASLLTQVSWIIIGCYGIARCKRGRRRKTPVFKSRRTPRPMSEAGPTKTSTALSSKAAPLWLAAPVVKGRTQNRRLIGQPGKPTATNAYHRPRSSTPTRTRLSTAQSYMH